MRTNSTNKGSTEATGAYENLARAGARIQSGSISATPPTNPGLGGLAAYRMAERRDPRDTALRANLQFVRTKVYSDERTRLPV